MNLKQITVFLFCTLIFQVSQAQSNLKIGHVNFQEIVQEHPSADSIRNVLETEAQEMENLYNEMIIEHESKLGVFEKEKSGYSDFVKSSKEKELILMTQKIQLYNQTAEQQLQKRNMELTKPIYDQINTLIKEISDQYKFSYILEVGSGAVAYVSPDSQNITPLVIEKLTPKK
jgi:outer membrane protein